EALVLAERTVDREHGQIPAVDTRVVDEHAIRMTWQHLAESRAADRPLPGLGHAVLELGPDTELAHGALPALAARAALVAESAQVLALVVADVAIARDVIARRASAVVVAVVEAVERAFGADAEVVIHEVVAELAGARAQAAGPDVRRRAHEYPCRVQRRRAEEHDARL